jgi:hypothetical protein
MLGRLTRKYLQGTYVCTCKVYYVDVVADSGAVWGVVIMPKNA